MNMTRVEMLLAQMLANQAVMLIDQGMPRPRQEIKDAVAKTMKLLQQLQLDKQ